MPRLMLVLAAAGYRASDFLDAARSLGAEVVVASDAGQTLRRVAGDGTLRVDLRRPVDAAAAMVALAQRLPLDGIVAADDAGVLAAALAAEQLGVRHNPPEAVLATRDKLRLRQALAGAGLPQPAFRPLRPGDDAAAVAAAVGLPCVVKPLALSASRGVIRADDGEAARAAERRVRAILAGAGEDPGAPLLVERYLPGAEVAVEAILRDGRLQPVAVFDKPDPLEGPYFEETIYVTPSRHPAALVRDLLRLTERAAAAIGLREGPLHAELRLHDGSARLLELAARSIGGLCSRSLRYGLGISLEELIVRAALGLPVAAASGRGAAGVMMLPIERGGVLRAVEGQEAARAVAGIAGLEITVPRGSVLRPLPEGDRYLGFLFARAPTPAGAEEALRRAHAELHVLVDERDPAAAAAAGAPCR